MSKSSCGCVHSESRLNKEKDVHARRVRQHRRCPETCNVLCSSGLPLFQMLGESCRSSHRRCRAVLCGSRRRTHLARGTQFLYVTVCPSPVLLWLTSVLSYRDPANLAIPLVDHADVHADGLEPRCSLLLCLHRVTRFHRRAIALRWERPHVGLSIPQRWFVSPSGARQGAHVAVQKVS